MFALQTLVHRIRQQGERGIFVVFEEQKDDLVRNSHQFGWNLSGLTDEQLLFLDARPPLEAFNAGAVDLTGLLAVLVSRARAMQATTVVLDGLDVYMDLLPTYLERRREMFRIHHMLAEVGLTTIITAKQELGQMHVDDRFAFMQFVVDCVVQFEHRLADRVSQRTLRIVKYRGSGFYENETPLIIGRKGMEVAGPYPDDLDVDAGTARITTGIAGLDDMFGGGYLRNTVILISGVPGTAKSTLAEAFLAATCARGETALMISFDELPNEIVRNAASVGIDLRTPMEGGLLHIYAYQREVRSAEAHLLEIRNLIEKYRPRSLVIDPISALMRGGSENEAVDVIARLLRYAKQQDVTVLMTSLLRTGESELENTRLPISTIADVWIHLTYLSQSGERNRQLSIIKARGIGHSNQVRELLLGKEGVRLSQVYTAGGNVLMGTMRWEREEQDRQNRRLAEHERNLQRRSLEAEELELRMQIEMLQHRLEAHRQNQAELSEEQTTRAREASDQAESVRRLRHGSQLD